MSDNNKVTINGTHQSIAVWAVTTIPLFGFFVCWLLLLSAGEFIDGVQGVGCDTPTSLVDSPQSIWNKGGCVVNNVRKVIPSRNQPADSTAP
ncbi:hypothetical protein [Laspinema olomoucense]|uniref:Uncharacterized protein n=1 Tax=Laspinema olomoucense D3b TaxID=2953688 RepID=A0ABT2NFP8_9CYAN|nr:hypothetical protein [Laspinema sp. D3b]MCT7981534.1 hypothetical protein [Laspinema sp. D3b]